MKNYNLIVLSVLMSLCLFTSCSSDDDDKKDSIVGTWIFSELIIDIKTNSTKNDALLKAYILEEYDYWANSVIEFKSDGTCVFDGDAAPYTVSEDGTVYITFHADDIEEYKYINNIFYFEEDEADYYNSWDLDVIMRNLGLPTDDAVKFQVEKATYKVVFKKK